MTPRETGNPVFDYRAGFRRRAAALQSALLTLGIILPVAAGILRLAGTLSSTVAIELAVGGAVVFVAGFSWGIYWRRELRADFRKTFGPDCATGTAEPEL